MITISNHPQLFLDDHIVAGMINLQRVLQQPKKHPANPVIVGDKPWEKRCIEIYGTVLYDPNLGKFRCWYLAGESPNAIPDTPDAPGLAEYYLCYAESNDGIHWTKPMVGRGKRGSYSKHNIIIPRGHGFCVLPSPDDPDPGKRFKGLGGNMIGFSPDGVRWDVRPFNAAGKNDTSSSVVRWKGEYLAYVRNQGRWANGVMREVAISTSRDFLTWTPKKTIFTTDKKDGYPWSQPYGLAVTPYGDLLIGIVWFIHLDKIKGNNRLGDQDMQLLVSRDGRNWERVADRAPFIKPTAGTWDQGRVWPGTTMFLKDDLVHIYYSGTNTRHGTGDWGRPGIGLATLPADRFVALRPIKTDTEGILKTQPLRFSGNNLLVNAEVGQNDLKVELLDAKGKVLDGFDRKHCRLVSHDKLRYRVVWQSEKGERSLRNVSKTQPTALRFILRKGSLYAFTVAD